jgi:hypothetical protein
MGGPLIGAFFDVKPSAADGKKRAPKPKTNKVTKGEKSVTEPAQQHGELASSADPKPISDKKLIRETAKGEKRRATEAWIGGRMSTKNHEAVHKRANHVLKSMPVTTFKGLSGEKEMKGGW